jgi:hypothetical protein
MNCGQWRMNGNGIFPEAHEKFSLSQDPSVRCGASLSLGIIGAF